MHCHWRSKQDRLGECEGELMWVDELTDVDSGEVCLVYECEAHKGRWRVNMQLEAAFNRMARCECHPVRKAFRAEFKRMYRLWMLGMCLPSGIEWSDYYPELRRCLIEIWTGWCNMLGIDDSPLNIAVVMSAEWTPEIEQWLRESES